MTSGYAWWERHGPRLPSHGIKAHTRRGAFGKSWWASRWIAALERLVIELGAVPADQLAELTSSRGGSA